MKIGLVSGLLAVFLSLAAAGMAEPPAKKKVIGYLCPLLVIDDYPPDALYYCDYMTTSCVWQDVGYFLGQLPAVPYVNCPQDCAPVYAVSKPFPGLPGKVPSRWMPSQPMSAAKPVPESPESQVKLYVNKTRNAHFISFTHEGERFAKVIEYRVHGPIHARCKNCADKKVHKKTDVGWQSAFVAFECEKPPGEETIYAVNRVEDALPGHNVKRTRIKYEMGSNETLPVLILLAQQAKQSP